MDRNRTFPLAGGFLLAVAVIAGAVTGMIYRQPSLGVVTGFGAGLAMATLIWLFDRRRR